MVGGTFLGVVRTAARSPARGRPVPAAGPSRAAETPGFASPPRGGFALSSFLSRTPSARSRAARGLSDRLLDEWPVPRQTRATSATGPQVSRPASDCAADGTRPDIARAGADRRGAAAPRRDARPRPSAGPRSIVSGGFVLAALALLVAVAAGGARRIRSPAAALPRRPRRRRCGPSSTPAAASPCRASSRSCRCSSRCRRRWCRSPSSAALVRRLPARRARAARCAPCACCASSAARGSSIGPAVVLAAAAGDARRRRRRALLLVAALAAQLLCDFGASAVMERLLHGASLREQLARPGSTPSTSRSRPSGCSSPGTSTEQPWSAARPRAAARASSRMLRPRAPPARRGPGRAQQRVPRHRAACSATSSRPTTATPASTRAASSSSRSTSAAGSASTRTSLRNLEFGALLHDVGKVAIPKEIINKPGKLDPHEWEIIKTHTVEGQRMLDQVGGFMSDVGRIVRSHHERWDGGGYPDGLAGEAIPIEARIISACDTWNAMTTDALLPRGDARRGGRGRAAPLRRHPVRSRRWSTACWPSSPPPGRPSAAGRRGARGPPRAA